MTTTATPTRLCPGCGATIAGPLNLCPRCTTSINRPSAPARTQRHRLRRVLTTLTLLPGLAGLGFTAWQLAHHTNAQPATTTAGPQVTTRTVAQPRTTTAAAAATTLPAAALQSCTSQTGGYSEQYPLGWVTESATPTQACRFFAAKHFTVLPTDTAAGDISIDTSTPGTYSAFVATFDHPGDASITLHHKPLIIDGHRAQQMNITVHAGTRITYGYGYVIEHDDKPLIIATTTTQPRSPTLQHVVTLMADSLQLH